MSGDDGSATISGELFETDGVVTLPGALPEATWRPLADSVRAALDRAGWRTENGHGGDGKPTYRRCVSKLPVHSGADV